MHLKETFHFARKALTVRKVWNVVAVLTSYVVSRIGGKPFVWGVPPVLMVEPTNLCNLRCPLCPSGNGTLRRARGFMDMAVFERLIDEIRGRTHMLLLWNQGESLSHREFHGMVRMAADAGLYTMASTNGHYFSDPHALVRSGLDSIIVSLDGASPETYRQYRVSGSFEKVIDGTRSLVAAKRELQSATPIIHLQFILFRHNEHETDSVKAIAEDLGVDKVTYKTAQIYDSDDVDRFLPTDVGLRRYDVDDKSFRVRMGLGRRPAPNRCRTLWLQPVVNWDGSVTPCCFDKHGDFTMGSLGNGANETLESIWHGGSFNAFRKRLMKDRSAMEMCRNCTEGIAETYEEHNV